MAKTASQDIEHTNVYKLVTEMIVEQLNKGIVPWQKPWFTCPAISYVSRKQYSLLNQMLLQKGGEYLTFKQIKELGGKVKKGSKSHPIVFYKRIAIKRMKLNHETNKMEEETKIIPMLKYYRVFHIDDVEGIESKTDSIKAINLHPDERAEEIVNGYVSRSKLTFRKEEGDRAYYSPQQDLVVVPLLSQYSDVAEYYSTIFHELSHSTGHKTRLHRNTFSTWGTMTYSQEELIAEISASFLCNIAELDCTKAFKNSVAYVQGWAKVIGANPKLISECTGRAVKASNYILGIEGSEEGEE